MASYMGYLVVRVARRQLGRSNTRVLSPTRPSRGALIQITGAQLKGL
jgi:hypothetical protein